MDKRKTAIFAGTFDPITKGHIDIIKRGLKIYDKIIIAIPVSSHKRNMFTLEDRIGFIEKSTQKLKNVEIRIFNNLLVEFAQENNISNIIRGIRDPKDFEYEQKLDYANKSLLKDIETVFLISKPKHIFVSSSLVRELIQFKGKFEHLVSKRIIKEINKLI